jgi:hypothetical protein
LTKVFTVAALFWAFFMAPTTMFAKEISDSALETWQTEFEALAPFLEPSRNQPLSRPEIESIVDMGVGLKGYFLSRALANKIIARQDKVTKNYIFELIVKKFLTDVQPAHRHSISAVARLADSLGHSYSLRALKAFIRELRRIVDGGFEHIPNGNFGRLVEDTAHFKVRKANLKSELLTLVEKNSYSAPVVKMLDIIDQPTRILNEQVQPSPHNLKINDSVYAQVSNLLPDFIKRVNNTYEKAFGPNCFSAALASRGFIRGGTMATNTEILFWLNSPICKARLPQEDREYMDIVLVNYTTNPIHAYIHIREGVIFEKGSQSRYSDYHLLTKSDWSGHETAYTCSDPKNFMRQSISTMNGYEQNQYLKLSRLVLNFEDQIRSYMDVLRFSALQVQVPSDYNQMQTDGEKLIIELASKLYTEGSSMSNSSRTLWKGLFYRVESLLLQFNFFGTD